MKAVNRILAAFWGIINRQYHFPIVILALHNQEM